MTKGFEIAKMSNPYYLNEKIEKLETENAQLRADLNAMCFRCSMKKPKPPCGACNINCVYKPKKGE